MAFDQIAYDKLEAATFAAHVARMELREKLSAAWDEAVKDFPEDSRQWTAEQNKINSKWCSLHDRT